MPIVVIGPSHFILVQILIPNIEIQSVVRFNFLSNQKKIKNDSIKNEVLITLAISV